MDEDDFGAVMAHQLAALLADRIRHDDDGLIAANSTDECEADALVAAGRLDDDGIRADQAFFLCFSDHIVRCTRFNRATDVQSFKFDEDICAVRRRHMVQPDDRRMSHGFEYVVINH